MFSTSWNWKIGRIAGIDIRVHATFVLLLVLSGNPAFLLAIFGCILLHELGHALAARGFGIETLGITLLPIGGVAHLERMPTNPWHELVIAIAGPAVNLALAAAFLLALVLHAGIESLSGASLLGGGILESLLAANIMLGGFNLLPALPMDGGRILRALLALRLGHVEATATAATVGRVLAVILGIVGLAYGFPFVVVIAVFVFLAAGAEAELARRVRAPWSGGGWRAVDADELRRIFEDGPDDRTGRPRPPAASAPSGRRARDVPFTLDDV
jgi:Zn-dependent protease